MNRTGKAGEDRAAALLEQRGMRIIARNIRSKSGEIDLVALDGEAIAFVEVKAWRSLGFEDLGLSVDLKKQRRIIETAKYFLSFHREYNCMSPRFDVLFMDSGPEQAVTYLVSAFTEYV
jgi:putative endonuclease